MAGGRDLALGREARGFKGLKVPEVVGACRGLVPDAREAEIEAAAQRVLASLAPTGRAN